MPFIPNTKEDQRLMLDAIGNSKIEDLLKIIPEEVRFRGDLNLPPALSEWEVLREISRISNKNFTTETHSCFIGGGAYDHFIPSGIAALLSRSEFYTAYTPYQGEVSQGTLQSMYEYQSMICELTGMDISNASLYDAGSGLAEAVLMACNITKRNKVVIVGKVHPNYLEVVRTYAYGQNIEIVQTDPVDGSADLELLENLVDKTVAAVIFQNPNFYGNLEDVFKISRITKAIDKTLLISVIDPISLGVIVQPAAYNADIVVGEAQGMGIGLQFGGPYCGIFATKKSLIRKLPGRLSGVTIDAEGKEAFVLTLQTREQHIRRDKATSNICTNQGLMALASTIYMALLGKEGIQEVAEQSTQKAHYLAEKICNINGYSLRFDKPFFKEFVVNTPHKPEFIIEALFDKGILGGIDLSRFDDKGLMITVTEKRSKAELDEYVELLSDL
ncbi:MAG: aminomethyl-transferring glycine dehydrogenase subunit GcvPA [Balneolales bacterium]